MQLGKQSRLNNIKYLQLFWLFFGSACSGQSWCAMMHHCAQGFAWTTKLGKTQSLAIGIA